MMNLLEEAAKKAAEHVQHHAGDYRNEEGLLVCGRCHTPKQVRITFMDTETTPYCMCRCESAAYERERAALRDMQRMDEIGRMRSEAFLDRNYHRNTFGRDDGANAGISHFCKRYAECFGEIREKNCGILFYGESGTGKSFYAACIVNALIDRGIPAFMTNVAELTKVSESDRRDSILQKCSDAALMVIDDMGSERKTDFALEQLYIAVDARYRSGKPLIVTSNYDPQVMFGWQDPEHKRIYDRIQEMCMPVSVEGVRRRNAAKDIAKTLNRILYRN